MYCSVDHDSYFLIKEGEYLAQNGIHHTDILTMHEGLNIVVQQYAFCIASYYIFTAFGQIGLFVGMLALVFAITLLVYKICMLLSDKNVNLSLLLATLTASLMSISGFFTTRPQMVSYVILLGVIYVLELFVKTRKTKYLWWLPVLSLLLSNLHASLWLLPIIVMGVYIVDSFKNPKLHLEGYPTKPLAIATAASVAAGFINPYGVSAVAYIFTSFNAAPIKEIVLEMKPFSCEGAMELVIYGFVVLTSLAYIFGRRKNIRMRHLILFFGFLLLGINAVRGLSQLILVMFFPMALLFKDADIAKYVKKRWRTPITVWSGYLMICVTLVVGFVNFATMDDNHCLIRAVNVIDDAVAAAGQDKSELKIYTIYDDGGYLEYRGYKPFIDQRAEVFLKRNNGKSDILKEWWDMRMSAMKKEDFLEKYDFDYLLVRGARDPLHFIEDEKYQVLYSNYNEHITIYKHIKDE